MAKAESGFVSWNRVLTCVRNLSWTCLDLCHELCLELSRTVCNCVMTLGWSVCAIGVVMLFSHVCLSSLTKLQYKNGQRNDQKKKKKQSVLTFFNFQRLATNWFRTVAAAVSSIFRHNCAVYVSVRYVSYNFGWMRFIFIRTFYFFLYVCIYSFTNVLLLLNASFCKLLVRCHRWLLSCYAGRHIAFGV